MRLAIVMLLLLPGARPRPGQATDDDRTRSPTTIRAGRLQMPPASTEVKEALDDFERFQRRGAWERAVEVALHDPRRPGAPVRRRRERLHHPGRAASAARSSPALPPEGQAAYRLFYDAEAKKLLDEAEGPAELKNLERVYSAYFITSVGDNAADRLGDLYFEHGPVRPRGRLLAGGPPRAARHRPLARPDRASRRPWRSTARGGGPSSSRSAPSWRTATPTRR